MMNLMKVDHAARRHRKLAKPRCDESLNPERGEEILKISHFSISEL
jgi:hypothetical protein